MYNFQWNNKQSVKLVLLQQAVCYVPEDDPLRFNATLQW